MENVPNFLEKEYFNNQLYIVETNTIWIAILYEGMNTILSYQLKKKKVYFDFQQSFVPHLWITGVPILLVIIYITNKRRYLHLKSQRTVRIYYYYMELL